MGASCCFTCGSSSPPLLLGGGKLGQVMVVAWQEEEGQFVLLWREGMVLRAKRVFEGQMLEWEEKTESCLCWRARSCEWVSCDSALQEHVDWAELPREARSMGTLAGRSIPLWQGCEHGSGGARSVGSAPHQPWQC